MYSPLKSITECIKFSKRAELWTDFWQLNNIFEPPGRNKLIVWKIDSHFFFLLPHMPYGRVRVTPFTRIRLLYHAFQFLYWFWGKNRLFCSLQFLGETVNTFQTDVERGWRSRVINLFLYKTEVDVLTSMQI